MMSKQNLQIGSNQPLYTKFSSIIHKTWYILSPACRVALERIRYDRDVLSRPIAYDVAPRAFFVVASNRVSERRFRFDHPDRV
jgi:hypothetical protein